MRARSSMQRGSSAAQNSRPLLQRQAEQVHRSTLRAGADSTSITSSTVAARRAAPSRARLAGSSDRVVALRIDRRSTGSRARRAARASWSRCVDLPPPDVPAHQDARAARSERDTSAPSAPAADHDSWRPARGASAAGRRRAARRSARTTPAPALAARDDSRRAALQARQRVGHRHGAPAARQQRVIVLRVADADDVVRRQPELGERGVEPGRLVDARGSTITAPLLKITCSSSPSSRIASITSISYGCEVATIDAPRTSGATPRRAAVDEGVGGGEPSRRGSRAGIFKYTAPFSATMASKIDWSGRHGRGPRVSGRSPSTMRRPLARRRASASRVAGVTTPLSAIVPS